VTSGTTPFVVHNRVAVFFWLFAIAYLWGLLMMSYLLIRDGLPADQPVWFVAAMVPFFWAGGIGLALYAMNRHCLSIRVDETAQVTVTWLYPFKRRQERFAVSSVAPAQVQQTKDSDGDPYFECWFVTPAGVRVVVTESHTRELCDTVCEAFNQRRLTAFG
jgi:hypothetical protein